MDLKTLGKMTVLKLREEALKVPGLVGVRGMNKEELIRALATAHNLDLAGRARGGAGKTDLKKQIRQLRTGITEAIQKKDSVRLKTLRRAVKRLKRQTRHLAAGASAVVPPTSSSESAA